jgi:serine/threonine protein kinase/tetratricopeptide (TPR) repeat protein
MDTRRWDKLKSILAGALEEESPAARTALVERLCSDDNELLLEAESLLAEADVILEEGHDDLEACAEDAASRIARDGFSEIGKRIGAYVVVRKIGHGGMGIVYLAARADGYFEKEVAIKVLNPGTDMEEILHRFRSEQQVLARLDHPNIARLLDAGTTDDGLPYFVMEYIEGIPVTRFIEENRPSVDERLHLFLKVCSAVEFAHRSSIVHRDLKPSNILVNREGEPKLLDFGIAKLLRPDRDPLDLTAPGHERLSPISASPEQAQGAAVTKSSDIYALGALLYEILTESRPHRFPTHDLSRSELVSILCEQTPVPPSLAVKDRERSRQIRGDLDAIVLKALLKEPAARYSSVRDFANDVHRYRAHEAVSVGKNHSFSRLFRRTYKNRGFRLAAAALAAVVLCLAMLTWRSLLGRRWNDRGSQKNASLTQSSAALAVPEKSIAVLPFDSFTGDKENGYFVDGVQDNILTDLAKVSDLRVIGRTSVESYRNVKKNPREIGESLRVSHVLEGSIQKVGDRIRVNIHLIDTRTEAEIWGEYYERTLDDLFALQSELAETIASRLKATLLPDEKAAIESRPTRDMVAYDLYLRAREEFYQYNYSQAIEFLDNATARDPKFAIAYAFLADANLYQYRFTVAQDPKHVAAAKIAADKALALAPDLAESHLAQAQYYYNGTRDFEAALRELTLASSPMNTARFFDLTALVQRRLGHWKEAIRNGERAAELDPRNPYIINELLESYLAVRRYQDAEELASKANQLLPPSNNARWINKAESFLGRGRLQEARAVVAEAPLARPPKVRALVRLDLFARDYDRAAEDLANMPASAKELPSTFLLEATVARARGDRERALVFFQKARDRILEKLVNRPNDPSLLGDLSWADAGLGRKEDAIREARQAVQLVPISRDAADGVTWTTMLAEVYMETGQSDAALEELAKIVNLPCAPNYGELRFDPVWDKVRTNPKFEELLQQSSQPLVYE